MNIKFIFGFIVCCFSYIYPMQYHSESKNTNLTEQLDNYKKMCKATCNGDFLLLQSLLLTYNPSYRHILCSRGYDSERKTLLHYAAAHYDSRIMSLLLPKFAFAIDFYSQFHRTALHLAAMRGYTDIIHQLLHHGAAVLPQDEGGNTAFHYMVRTGDVKSVEEILSNNNALEHDPYDDYCGTSKLFNVVARLVNTRNSEGETPLYIACQQGHFNIFQQLLAYQKNASDTVNECSENGVNLFDIAMRNKNFDIADFLFPLTRENSFYMQMNRIVERGEYEQFCYLLQKNISVNTADPDFMTPLHLAARANLMAFGQKLLSHGAIVNAKTTRTGYEGFTPLHIAITKGHRKFAILMLQHPSAGTISRQNLITALIMAIKKGFVDVVDTLLSLNFFPKENAFDSTSNPVDIAITNGNYAIAKKLSEHGFSCSQQQLHSAIESGNVEHVQICLNFGSNVNNYAPDGNTPLMHAIINGKESIVKELLNHGANPTLTNNDGLNSIRLALFHNQFSIIKLFLHAARPMQQINRRIVASQLQNVSNNIKSYSEHLTTLREKQHTLFGSVNFLRKGAIGLSGLFAGLITFNSIQYSNITTPLIASAICCGVVHLLTQKIIYPIFEESKTISERLTLQEDALNTRRTCKALTDSIKSEADKRWVSAKLNTLPTQDKQNLRKFLEY